MKMQFDLFLAFIESMVRAEGYRFVNVCFNEGCIHVQVMHQHPNLSIRKSYNAMGVRQHVVAALIHKDFNKLKLKEIRK